MPPNFVLDRRDCVTRTLYAIAALVSLAGCAKFPTTVDPDSTRVIFKMTVKGEINPSYVYVIPIRASIDPNPVGDGPIPVLQFPNANGFVQGNVNFFVLWTPDTQQYTIYKFRDSSLIFFDPIGTPINITEVTAGSRALGFEISMEQLFPGTSSQYQALQVNFLTMNRKLDQAGAFRNLDCLGNTNLQTEFNEPVKIPLATTGIYDNVRFNFIEPLSVDCPDPDLDIDDWSIEVRRPQ